MKVLIFDYGYCGPPHHQTEAEIIQQHLDTGDEVIRLACTGEAPVCLFNRRHELALCNVCISRREATLALVQPKVPRRSIFQLTEADRKAVAAFRFEGTSFAELKELTFENFDIGLAVASILVDVFKNPEPDLIAHREYVRDWIGTSLAAYLSALNLLDAEKPDRAYVFSGKWTCQRAALRACQARGIDCFTHERGGSLDRYDLSENRLFHEIGGHTKSVEDAWRNADPATREKIGGTYFEEKAGGIERQWYSFVTEQKRGHLPEGWNPELGNIAVFLSSEFEFAAVGKEYRYPFYRDQNEGIARILAELEKADLPFHLHCRIHPNMRGVRNANIDWLLALRSPKGTIIPPESPVSSYALLHACDKTLAFGSTMGIESTYWGKPSILAGKGLYQYLGGTYNPGSHEELMRLLIDSLEPKPREAALKFGYYELMRGQTHRYYKPETFAVGTFRGVNIESRRRLDRLMFRLARAEKIPVLGWLLGLPSRWHRHRTRQRLGIEK